MKIATISAEARGIQSTQLSGHHSSEIMISPEPWPAIQISGRYETVRGHGKAVAVS
jgi:hypothetical protein